MKKTDGVTRVLDKIREWWGASNRLHHLAGGFALGIMMQTWWDATVMGFAAGGALEYKDKAYGGRWDWLDLGLTSAGALMGRTLAAFAGG